MGLSARLGLRQANMWEPPTMLDAFLASPLQFVVFRVYSVLLFLRGPAGREPSETPIRVVCISDTHDHTVEVPPGDLLVHAGDLTHDGSVRAIQKQLDSIGAQPHRHKVVVCGNHDSWFDPASRKEEDKTSGAEPDLGSIHYLEHSSVTLDFAGGRRLNVFGAPDVPQCGGSDFA